MTKLAYVFIMAAVLFISSGITNAHAVDCDNPCGALELIECAAQKEGMTAEDYYNKDLFDSRSILDGFSKEENFKKFCTEPTVQQQYYYDNFCKKNTGKYYSYENFKEALESGHFAEFCCAEKTTKEQRYKELANFLATIASETTGVLNDYKNDGLFYRYENGSLLGDSMQEGNKYLPPDDWKVARDSLNPELINTEVFWGSDTGGEKANVLTPATSPMGYAWGLIEVPAGFEKIKMNEMIEKGLWCGMGPTQLTGYTMVGFFGWYYNNVEHEKAANFKDFVNNYLVDGKVGFMGALWYWMYQVSGRGYRTPHQAVTNVEKLVCQDIACATMMVNGGCNDYPINREKYYFYFISTLLHDYKIVEVKQEFSGQILENMKCPWIKEPTEEEKAQIQAYIEAFLGYCRPK
jgi:hypothetical protein